ncbi:glycosyltransferase [Liquorilactobacillus oeni DSM 19972]|uniref:Glycosyltransferase n=2 Tax=Liquorilactobacillus oeni TaxID=303241 RepID=A0A0R1MLH8_9LACO|nr:glycosyltransferase [Liquorilactobacillus oeni DSM 19972]
MDGVKRVATVVGNELAKKHQVFYYSLSTLDSFFHLEAPLLYALHPINTGKSFRADHPLEKFAQQISDLIATIKEKQIDVAVLNAGLFTSFAPLLKQHLPKVKLISWMHNNYETYHDSYYKDMLPEFIAGLNTVDALVVLTEHDLKKFSQHNNQTLKIYNPVTLSAKKHSNLTKPIIAVVCRLDIQHKGIDLLLKVGKRLPQPWQIRIAGNGPEKEKVQTIIKQEQLSHKVILTGALTDQELQEHYQNASIFAMASRWEGLPLVIGEAMDCGLPIISMWNTGAQEYLQGGKFGILTSDHDVTEFFVKLSPLLKNIVLRQHWSKIATQRAESFQLPLIIKQWEALLQKLVFQ